jgi:hypothetical protein
MRVRPALRASHRRFARVNRRLVGFCRTTGRSVPRCARQFGNLCRVIGGQPQLEPREGFQNAGRSARYASYRHTAHRMLERADRSE